MKTIKNQCEFDKYFQKYLNADSIKQKYQSLCDFWGEAVDEDLVIIENYNFKDIKLTNIHYQGLQFRNCIFENTQITHSTFHGCIFKNCKFIKLHTWDVFFLESDFISSLFNEGTLSDSSFCDITFDDTLFEHCHELIGIRFGGVDFKSISFNNVFLGDCIFEGHQRENYNFNLSFLNSDIEDSSFVHFNLSETQFKKCTLIKTSFIDCTLKPNTIDKTNTVRGEEFAFIDFQTIIKSDSLKEDVLSNCFGINDTEVKKHIHSITRKIEYQTVFISYSLKDKIIANVIYDYLHQKGINLFLWEHDALGGENLKKIMRDNIKKHDRLLFISSENSIKSKACQFELSQGRNKQNAEWRNILFPIHIDDYLFQVNKEDIKPLSSQDEYWENILELREINSLDFTNARNPKGKEFERKINELLKGLRR